MCIVGPHFFAGINVRNMYGSQRFTGGGWESWIKQRDGFFPYPPSPPPSPLPPSPPPPTATEQAVNRAIARRARRAAEPPQVGRGAEAPLAIVASSILIMRPNYRV